MNEYRVLVAASARKEFRGLPTHVANRVRTAVRALRDNPRPAGVRKLTGHERRYRMRVGDYRIIYDIDDQARVVDIIRVRHRSDVYD